MTHWAITAITGDGDEFMRKGVVSGLPSARRAAAAAVLAARDAADGASIVVVAHMAGACASLVINADDPPMTLQQVINALTVIGGCAPGSAGINHPRDAGT